MQRNNEQQGLGRLSAQPRETSCNVKCSCGAIVPTGIPEDCAVLPRITCSACGAEVDDRAVWLGNLMALRRETLQLGDTVGGLRAVADVVLDDGLQLAGAGLLEVTPGVAVASSPKGAEGRLCYVLPADIRREVAMALAAVYGEATGEKLGVEGDDDVGLLRVLSAEAEICARAGL